MSEEDQTIDVVALPKFDMPRAIPDAMAWRHHDLDIDDSEPNDGFSEQDVQTLAEKVIDLYYVPSRLLFQGGLATTWDFPGFLVTMSECLRFPFLSGATIEKGSAITNQDLRAQHTILRLLPHAREKIVLPPRKERRKRGAPMRERVLVLKGKGKKTSAARRDSSAASEHVSSLEPIWMADPAGPNIENPSEGATNIAESQGDQSLHASHHDLANHSMHEDQTEKNLTIVPTEVLQTSPGDHSVYRSLTVERTTSPARLSAQGAHGDEGESSRDQAYYVSEWFVHQRCRVDKPMWCQELMIHLAPLAAQEESNALDNSTALEKAWFALGRGALAQADMLERFENLQANYNSLAETHADCGDTIRQLLKAREASQQSLRLYLEMSEREERSKEDLLALMSRLEGFDVYTDKKIRVYPDSPLSGQAPPNKPSSSKVASTSAPPL
nr:hypothetical protein [Tanacetum cinerariifolium]